MSSKDTNEPKIPFKKSISAQNFATRWKRRSLDPTTRINSMLPTKEEIDKKDDRKILLKKKTKLSVEDRLKDMLDNDNTNDK